ncbi:sulfatase [Verrucomicrobiaceae bacterium 227]
MKKRFLISILLAVAAPVFSADRPNIVFIVADDLGWADTTLYGHTRLYQTPNIERLAKRGMTFSRAYAASPLCSPTRASILTGQTPARTGLTAPNCHLPPVHLTATPGVKSPPGSKSIQPNTSTRLRTDVPTLGKALKKAGYATSHFGKWHLGPEPYSPLEQGFDIDIPHWAGPGPAGSFVAPWKFPDFDPATPKEHIEDRMANEAVAFLEANKDKPFFLNYWMFSVHAPFDAKKDLIEKYKGLVNPSDPQRSPTYAAMIESMDDAVGTLMDTLDRLNIADNTIIIFFSDNGGNMYNEIDGTTPTSNAPLRGGKASMFEGGVRVPLIVAWPPKIEADSKNEALVQSTDFYPTLLEILDLQKEEGQIFDGVSILPALEGKPFSRDAIFNYFPHNPPVPDWIPPSISVHHKQWKLIREFHQGENGAHRYRLFDLESDIGETKNLASEHPELVKELDTKISKHIADTRAVVPIPNPEFDPAKYRPELEGANRVRNAPKPTSKSQAKNDPFDPKLEGWKARNSKATVKDGIITLKATGSDPFLGVGVAQHKGTATITVRAKAPKGGKGKVTWANGSPKIGAIPFELKAGEWTELSLTLPAKGSLGILRVHLPAQDQEIQVDSITLSSGAGTTPQTWNF